MARELIDCSRKEFGIEALLALILTNRDAMSPSTHEQIDGTGPASATSVNTYAGGSILRLVAINNSATFVFGAGPADATDIYLAPDTPEYFWIADESSGDNSITVFGAMVDVTLMI